MIIRIDPASAVPPYAQVREQIATMVHSRVLRPDTRLPAIRHLANDLGVAPNTIARAYRELEAAGLVASHGRHGTVVQQPTSGASGDDLLGAASAFALEASHRGLNLEQALDAVRAAFRGLDDHRRLT